MPPRATRLARVAGLAMLVVALAAALAFRAALARAFVAAALDIASGYRVSFTDLSLADGRATARGLRVGRQGQTLLEADGLSVRYRLRDLLPGGEHRYGLVAFDLERPRFVLVRHADGTFDAVSAGIVPPAQIPAGAGPASAAPLAFTGRVHQGSITLVDRARALSEARELSLDAMDATIAYDSAAESTVTARAQFAGDPAQRVNLDGRLDRARGYALLRLRARDLGIVPIANYFINTPAARFTRGIARAADIRLYGFPSGPQAAPEYHLAGSLQLEDGAMRVPGLVPSATGLRGRVDFFDGGLAAPRLAAGLGELDVRLAGGLLNWQAPAFRLGISAPRATLEGTRTLFAFSQKLPIAGAARLTTFLEGPVAAPLVATRIVAPALTYAHFPLSNLGARAIYYRQEVDIVGLRGRYSGLDVAANGTVALGKSPFTQLAVGVAGPAARIPYLAEVAPGALLEAGGAVTGYGLRLQGRGAFGGEGGGTRLAGVFTVDPRGDGSFGPLLVQRVGGASLAGAFYLDRSAIQSGFWLDARGYPYAQIAHASGLAGLKLTAPVFRGILDGALAGVGPPSDFRVAGVLAGREFRVGGLTLTQVGAHVAGHLGNLRLGDVSGRGPWGAFRGQGAYVGAELALSGRYDGSFSQLATLTGDLGARGPVRGPVALLVSPKRTVVQARGASSAGARVRGVPLERLWGTLAIAGKHLRIYAATGVVANGTMVAAGTLEGPRTLGISLAGAQAARLHNLVPLGGGGRLSAIGSYGLVAGVSHFAGGLALGEGSTLDRLPLEGNGDVSLAGTRLDFSATDARVGAALGTLAGSLVGVGTPRPHYDARLHLLARLAPFVLAAFPQQDDVAGTLTGDVRIRGTAANLALTGSLGIPEGTANGLAFRDASAQVRVDTGGITARAGSITVGSTRAAFGAVVRARDAALRLDVPRADLADFNDFFDAGDTLGGRGRIAAHFNQSGAAVRTGADIAIAGLHYRRFDLGDARARWNSRGSAVVGTIAFGGASGHLESAGTLGLASRAPLAKLLVRSRFDGTAKLRGLDLGVWLPALGYQVPISGRVDADATIAGPLRDPDIRTEATLAGGSIGKLPVDRLVLSASSTLNRTTLRRAELDLPSVSFVGSGSFGLRAGDRLALAIHAKSSNIGSLAGRLTSATYPLSGAAEMDVKVDGTRARPRVAGGFDLEDALLRGVKIPRALGQFSLSGRDVVLSSVEVGFATGALYLAGSVPLQVAPLGFGPAAAPVSLEVAAKGVDLANFASLLPAGSQLGGKIDGQILFGGTAGAPRLNGSLALAGGTIVSPFEKVPLREVGATLSFAGNSATLKSLHAESGGGTLDASGTASFPNLVHPGSDATYGFVALAKRLRLDLPAYGNGQVDGTLLLAHAPHARPKVGGTLALSEATIPFAALLIADSGGGNALGAAPPPPPALEPAASDVALDLTVRAERNVRVRSSNVDIGGQGELHVGGSVGAPQLAGGFDSTGGTLTYFNTVFRLIDGRVSFSPDLGLIPTLDARAITHVIDPDPNAVRNVAGSADVSLEVTGPVTNMSIALTSDPPYDRQQILGLLLNAPALGASNLFGQSQGVPTLYGSNTFPGASLGVATARNSNGQFSVAQEAFGIANAQFTRTLLAPIESTFAQAVGLSNFNVNVDYTGGVGLTARKVLGKKINAVYGTSFGYPYRQTFGFEIKPNDATAAQVSVFQTFGATGFTSLAPATFGASNLRLQAAQPGGGTVGFSLSLQHLFR